MSRIALVTRSLGAIIHYSTSSGSVFFAGDNSVNVTAQSGSNSIELRIHRLGAVGNDFPFALNVTNLPGVCRRCGVVVENAATRVALVAAQSGPITNNQTSTLQWLFKVRLQ